MRDVRFGRYKTKKQISAIAAVDILLSHDAKVNKPMWDCGRGKLCDVASVNK